MHLALHSGFFQLLLLPSVNHPQRECSLRLELLSRLAFGGVDLASPFSRLVGLGP